jgi:exonuclease III
MRIVSWNLNHCMRSAEERRQAWAYLRDELRADVALVQEAQPPSDVMSVYQPIEQRRYNWGSAVVAFRPGLTLRPRVRVTLSDCYFKGPAADELPDSHPGACAVSDVLDESEQLMFTAVSVYGQWEVMAGDGPMYACARTHRILSDLTDVLKDSRRRPVVLAGDFNLTTQGTRSSANHAAVAFARLSAWNMVDCIARTRSSRARLADCDCGDGAECSHVQTFRAGNAPSGTTQLDYAFVSEAWASALRACTVVHDDAAWRLSDHCPIVLDLD